MKKILVTLFLSAICTQANAEWQLVTVNDTGDTLTYIEPKSIKRRGNISTVWELFSSNKQQYLSNGTQYLSFKSKVNYDCKKETKSILAFAYHKEEMGHGEVVITATLPTNEVTEDAISPDSVSWAVLEKVCIKK